MICPLSNTIQNVTDVSSKKYQQEKKSQNYTFWNVFFMNQWFGFKKISQFQELVISKEEIFFILNVLKSIWHYQHEL